MNNRYIQSALILAGATSYYWMKYLYAYVVFGVQRYNEISVNSRQWLISVSVVVLCSAIAVAISSFSVKKTVQSLGLDKHVLQALLIAAVCTLPMYVGAALYSSPNVDFGWLAAIKKAVWPGFNEELVFRGFIIGLLVRKAGWHFIPAVLLSAVAFAWGHLYQAADAGQAILVFLVTSGAGIGFAIFYKMWGWNLWFPIFMHILMNLSFAIFHTGHNVLLDRTSNIFRGVTILLGIIASIYINYRNKRNPELDQRDA
ncbi:MAG TPA: CPBP family intramembrane glutamic endopeptidase [Flavipsychrobacter sp.]